MGQGSANSNRTGETAITIAAIKHTATLKTAIVDADESSGQDSANGFGLIRYTFLNLYTYLKTKLDLVHQAILVSGTNIKTINGATLLGSTDIVIPIGFNSIRGTVSVVGATAQTAFVVTFGGTQPNTTYFVGITPLNALTAAQNYIMTKTTTSFTVTYLTGLTGTVAFDWVLHQ